MSDNIVIEELEDDDNEGAAPVVKTIKRVEAPPKVVKAKAVPMADWPRIKLEENDSIPPVGLFIGYNGQSYILRPGMETAVPPGVMDILNHAVMTVPQKDPNTLQVVGWRDRLRYPYSQVQRRTA